MNSTWNSGPSRSPVLLSKISYLLCRTIAASSADRNCPVRSTTAYFFVPLSSDFLIHSCTPTLIPMSIGIITMLAMNALVCTADLYSRQATAQTLRMDDLLGLGFGPGDANENLLQRRPG